jgi:NADPH:quinone reductase-like Zn-dependent oxidoreductase
MATLGRLIVAGEMRPAIDRTYGLAELPDAVHHMEGGHARGKLVVVV